VKCIFCKKPDSECLCTFYCAECGMVMVKDEEHGGHLCPVCDEGAL
jgi:hypothetical protein